MVKIAWELRRTHTIKTVSRSFGPHLRHSFYCLVGQAIHRVKIIKWILPKKEYVQFVFCPFQTLWTWELVRKTHLFINWANSHLFYFKLSLQRLWVQGNGPWTKRNKEQYWGDNVTGMNLIQRIFFTILLPVDNCRGLLQTPHIQIDIVCVWGEGGHDPQPCLEDFCDPALTIAEAPTVPWSTHNGGCSFIVPVTHKNARWANLVSPKGGKRLATRHIQICMWVLSINGTWQTHVCAELEEPDMVKRPDTFQSWNLYVWSRDYMTFCCRCIIINGWWWW